MEGESGSLEALQLQQKPPTEGPDNNLEETKEGEDEDEERGSHLSELNQSLPPGELPSSHVDQFSEPQSVAPGNDQCVGLHNNSASGNDAESKFKDGVSNSEISTCAMTQGVESQPLNQLQSSQQSVSLSEISPASVTQSTPSAPSTTLQVLALSPSKSNNAQIPETDHHKSPNFKSLSVPIVKTQVPDGYNWRKYGQKQVKSPTGSRSYYKCTFSDCCAKKIECADHSGNIVEIVNKGNHSHDPPQKNNSTNKSKVALSSPPVVQDSRIENSTIALKDSEQAASLQETKEVPLVPDKKRHNSSGCNENSFMQMKEDRASEPEPKRRLKKENLETDGTHLKPGKKPKFVVHAAGDVGISGDGYRWRKYGQKMVKGNPNPRNYYRCTSAGCPVRKLIETAADNTSAVIITYKGVHDHDMPVPKKRHGQPSAPLVAAAAPASMANVHLKKPDAPQNQVTSTQWSVGKGGELKGETLDVGGEKDKAIESARTLLSIGFEIKPC